MCTVRISTVVAAIGLTAGVALAQPSFSIDFQGPTIALPDTAFAMPITEAEILIAPPVPPPPFLPKLGPMPAPATAGFGGAPAPGPGLGLALWPAAVGHAPGVRGMVEVDALSYGKDFVLTPAMTVTPLWVFSVDEFAIGMPGPGPCVFTEGAGAGGAMEASADVFVDFPPMGPGPIPPPGGGIWNLGIFDGNGMPPFGGRGYGLIEPNPPTPGIAADPGDNLDALDVDTMMPGPGFLPYPVFFSLDSAFIDPIEGPPVNSGSAAAHGFVGGDVLVSFGPAAPPIIYAPAMALGLDMVAGPDSDDLDALILRDNGDGVFQVPTGAFSWVGGATDMILFSVRRGSAVIGRPDSMWGRPIEPGDILMPPIVVGGLPAIWMPAEALGLATSRLTGVVFGDDLDAADTAADCDGNRMPDGLGILLGITPDCNGNGIPDSCDIASGTSRDCNSNGVPDECDPLSIMADFEPDGDVDGFDFLTFSNCFNGSNRPPLPGCQSQCADLDIDGDVDGFDFLTFSNCFNGSNKPPRCP